MTNQHLIIPPSEMVEKWVRMLEYLPDKQVFSEVAQWGADQELEACCEWVKKVAIVQIADNLHAARRPKPPSLKEKALLQLDTLSADLAMHGRGCDLSQIRRAIEALPND
jgi:hypothetical protein